jgi:hypothetical protein
MRLPFVLAASLLANATMIAVVAYHPAIAPRSVRDLFSFRADSPAEASRSATRKQSADQRATGTAANAWSKLQNSDLRELVARLRAAGFPTDVIRSIVAAQIDAQFAPRYKELGAKLWSPQFWKSDSQMGFNSKLLEELNALSRERSKLQRGILGDESLASTEDATAAQRRRFGDLPKGKIDLLQQVEDDYNEMIGQVRGATQGIVLPEDRDKLALLEREKHADLAAILSPAELADYEMRTSNITSRLRPALTIMAANEQEFRTIYDVQKEYKDVLYPDYSLGFMGIDSLDKRRQAQAKANEEVKAALGDARYADFARANDREYQQLYRIAKTENLPIEQANQTYALRSDIAAQSVRIADDPGLSGEDKRAALRTLAENAKVQITGLLGQTGGTNYAAGARWLGYIENGAAVTFNADGTPSMRPVRTMRPGMTPTPAPKG